MYIDGVSQTFDVPFHLRLRADAEALEAAQNPTSANQEETGDKVHSTSTETKSDKVLAQDTYTSELTEEERQKLEELRARDREVRQHEEAHRAAAGPLGGPPQYEFETGPDGQQYAVGGHVPINTSEGNSPDETIQRMQTVRRAALAPANPSGQDIKVAQEATRKETEARQEKSEELQSSPLVAPPSNDSSPSPATGVETSTAEPPTQNTESPEIESQSEEKQGDGFTMKALEAFIDSASGGNIPQSDKLDFFA